MPTWSPWRSWTMTIWRTEMSTPLVSTRLRIVVLFSLLLNVALLVALAATWWRHEGDGRGGRFGGVVRMPQMAVLERALPGSDLPVLQRAYALHRPTLGASFRAVRAAKREVRAALTATPFERDRLSAALAVMRGEEQGMAAAAHALLVDVAAGISAEGRQALAKIVTSRRMWRGPRQPRAPETSPAGNAAAGPQPFSPRAGWDR